MFADLFKFGSGLCLGIGDLLLIQTVAWLLYMLPIVHVSHQQQDAVYGTLVISDPQGP